jgi:hypothetical protein
MVQTKQLGGPNTVDEAGDKLAHILANALNNTEIQKAVGLPEVSPITIE